MPALSLRWKVALLAVLSTVLLLMWRGSDSPGASADEKKPTRPGRSVPVDRRTGEPLPRLYYGISSCGDLGKCHDARVPRPPDGKVTCRLNEMTIFEQHDKHGDAYKVLEGERGKQMLAILKLGKASEAKACLSCHAINVENDREKDETFKLSEGVSCVVCHGPYEAWHGAHSLPGQRARFRKESAENKEKHYGMTNLWDPLRRARLCASCHVGNVAEGKVVTHEMYAAGHPPLPGFEIASFSNQEPRHWLYLSEKPKAVLDALGFRGEEQEYARQEQTKLVLVGAAVSLSESMALLADEARRVQKLPEDERVLDLAHFDCYACHHNLRPESERQRSTAAGKPGRIPPKTWPGTLARLSVAHLAPETAREKELGKYDGLLMDLHRAYLTGPYGDLPGIEKTATALAAYADVLADRLNAVKINRTAARRIHASIPGLFLPGAKLLDFDSARQIGWAYDAIYEELYGKEDKPAALLKLSEELSLQLPKGRMGKAKEGPIVQQMDATMKKLYDFRASEFARLLEKVNGTPAGK